MSWITIDQDKCNACGICAKRCVQNFTNNNGVITANANELTCVLCGHCVALCRTGAITHNKMDMNNFPEVKAQININTDDFLELVRQRRSQRAYRDRMVPREDLRKLIDMCRYSPTGGNLQTVQIKIITNPDKIKKLSDLSVDYLLDVINQIENKINKLTAEGKEIPKDLALRRGYSERYKRLGLARDMGLDPILHKAPVVMIFHSTISPSTPKDDCTIAAQTVVLGAMTMGLGSCYIGLLNRAGNEYPPLKKELDLPPENTIHSVLVIGYPTMKYVRAVDRKPMKVVWE